VRELRNVVERLLLLTSGDAVDGETVRLALPAGAGLPAGPLAAHGAAVSNAPGRSEDPPLHLARRVEEFERATILAELERHKHHMTKTARALGLERSHLYKKCQQLGIDLRQLRKAE
jgi:DNA-binding NtrC family response regulator